MEVLHRERKQGLGRAYLAGFERGAGSRRRAGDGDGLRLLARPGGRAAPDRSGRGEADLVLGSRYVPGGGITNWGMARRLLSRGGSAYARILLRVPVRDLTGGFKCFNRRVLEALELDTMHADGYGFQIELTYRALKAGFSVKEVPIVFREREVGTSKMTARIALEAVWKVPALRWRLK